MKVLMNQQVEISGLGKENSPSSNSFVSNSNIRFQLDEDVLADEINQKSGRFTSKTKSKQQQQQYDQFFNILDSYENSIAKRMKLLKKQREYERRIRFALRAKKLPERVIVRARTTDVKGEMMQTNPATFAVESNREDAGLLERVSDRGFFYEELNMITDERSPLIISL
ncbi:MAG: hypothetical protein EZS28_019587, partial [Streblomastix strix]